MTLAAHVLWPASWAVIVVFFVGLVKECWDQRYGSGFCILDIAFNIAGIVGAVVLVSFLPKGVFD